VATLNSYSWRNAWNPYGRISSCFFRLMNTCHRQTLPVSPFLTVVVFLFYSALPCQDANLRHSSRTAANYFDVNIKTLKWNIFRPDEYFTKNMQKMRPHAISVVGLTFGFLPDWLIMSMGSEVSEPWLPTGLFLSPRWCVSVDSHGDDDVSWRKLLTRPPELSGSPASRDIWEQVGGMDKRLRISHISI
jgi:hypothetical protein